MNHGNATSTSMDSDNHAASNGPSMTPNGGGLIAKVQKQVIRVKAQRDDVLVNMYIKLVVPAHQSAQIIALFPDDGIHLRSSQVCAVQTEDGGSPIIPQDASRSLHRAADLLYSSKVAVKDVKGSMVGTSKDANTDGARITISNFQVSFVLNTNSSPRRLNAERLHYIAFLQISVPYASRPPKWPFIVQIPLARCLNNHLHFEGDETCLDSDTVVEVDPPLVSKSIAPSLSRQNSNDATSLSSSPSNDEMQSLAGPFHSTSSLTLRWARAGAGKEMNGISDALKGLTPIKGDMLKISAIYLNPRQVNDKSVEMDFEARISILGAFCPSLDSTATLGLSLVGASWLPNTISAKPATAEDAAVFHSVSTTRSMTSPLHFRKATSPRHSNGNGGLSRLEPYTIKQEQSDIDTTLDEGGTILNTRPPKGLVTSELEYESDDDYLSSSPSKRQADRRRRRYSLGARADSKEVGMTTSSTIAKDKQELLHILIKTTPLSLGSGDFTCNLQGKALFSIDESTADGLFVKLPYMRAAGIALQYEASIRGADSRITKHGRLVRVDKADRAATHSIDVQASSNETQETFLVAHIGSSSSSHEDSKTSPSASDNESLQTFANTTLQTERDQINISTQATQIESLSGMIQQASVDIVASPVYRDDELILAEEAQRRIRMTHTVKLTWPSTPAPTSGWLPEMVFAMPIVEGCDIEILYAGINGLCADVKQDTEQVRTGSSRMIDLKLPSMLREASKIDVLLIFTQESDSSSSFCAMPSVASSVAELTISINCQSLLLLVPKLHLALSPLQLHHQDQSEGSMQAKALMVPSMTNVSFTLIKKASAPLAIIPAADGPLRRSSSGVSIKRGSRWSLLHLLLTLALALSIGIVWQQIEPIQSLESKVDSLALALNVDFSDGSWTPGAAPSKEQLHQYLDPASQEADIPISERTASPHSIRISGDPHELSIESRSFVQILSSIPTKAGRAISWPLRLLYKLFF